MSQTDELTARIAELETKIAFQDFTIEELNQALIQQQFMMDKLQLQMRHLAEKLSNARVSNIATAAEETPPPHY